MTKRPAYSIKAVNYAADKVREDGLSIFGLYNQDKTRHNKWQSAIRGKKPVAIDVLQPIIDSYPRFLDYLNEYKEPDKDTAALTDTQAELKQIKQEFQTLAKLYQEIAEDKEVARKYVALLERIIQSNVGLPFDVRGLLDEASKRDDD